MRARLVVLEVTQSGPGAVDWEKLTACQGYAACGKFAQAMAGYLRWLAPRYEELQGHLAMEVARVAEAARSTKQHRRTPYNLASLAVGLEYFLRFAQEVGVLSEAEASALCQRAWQALESVAAAQEDHQASSEPARRFLQLLSAAIASGRAHVAAPDGREPELPQSWGWREAVVGSGDYERTEWRPQGRRIGWVEGDDLYLEGDAAYAEAQQLASQAGESLTVTLQTLKKRLKERGLLASTETRGGRERLEVRRSLEGNRRAVLYLRSTSLVVEKVAQVAQDRSGQYLDPGPIPGTLLEGTEEESQNFCSLESLASSSLDGPEDIYRPGPSRNDPWDSFLKERKE